MAQKERVAAYNAALKRLRVKYQDEFDGLLVEEQRARGLVPSTSRVARARRRLDALLAAYPELRDEVVDAAVLGVEKDEKEVTA